jgi:5-carboxymethyl-2-hydroxymuconate isomerase
MPHVVVQYTDNLGPEAAMGELCRALAAAIVGQRDAAGARVFPIGGTRVLAYPARDFAVGDGGPDRAFVYVNARIAAGRSPDAVKAAGEALLAATQRHFASIFASRPIGITVQIDEGEPMFDAKHSNLHPLFEGR